MNGPMHVRGFKHNCPTMMSEQWQRSKQLFALALEQAPEQREAFVRENCSDSELTEQILMLLEAHEREPEFLRTPLGERTETELADPLIGQTVGAFVIQRLVGHGGSGAVYEATQTNPVRRVAVKFLRADVPLSGSVLRRFENESEMLARLKHRGIAHVYESGKLKTAQGDQPWFAMELVEGPNLTQLLRDIHLSRDDKLKLFLKICDAVSSAHSKGVVHRDLKPANILVEQQDATENTVEGLQPKVVDFGIAMMQQTDDFKTTLLTTASDILGTLDYVSPEQVGDDPTKVDQRCDVYALGLVLFEMLTGRLPHYRRSNSVVTAIKNIGNENMLRLREVDSGFSRELDVVVEKATRVQPGRRYQSIDELAADIKRLLANEPIHARPPSPLYIGSKFVKRNFWLVAGVAATTTALAIGLILYAWEADAARKSAEAERKSADAANYEADKAVAVSSYITNDFLTRLLALSRNSDSVDQRSVESMVDESAIQIESMFANQPTIEAAIHNEVGTIYFNIGVATKAADQYREALRLWESELGPNHADTLKAVNNLALAQMSGGGGDAESTEVLLRRAKEGRVNVLGEAHMSTLQSYNNLADWLRRHDRLDEAEPLFVEALKLSREHLGPADQTTMIITANLGSLYLSQDRLDDAFELHRQAYHSACDTLGDDHRIALQAGIRLAQTTDRVGKYKNALETLEPILNVYLEMKATPELAIVPLRLKSRILRHMEKYDDALASLAIASEIAESDPDRLQNALRKIERDRGRIIKEKDESSR